MVNKLEIGEYGETEARTYLISRGFEIIDTNDDKPLHFYDLVVKKDEALYVVNVKYTSLDAGGSFSIGLSNLAQLIKHSHTYKIKLMFLLGYKDNFIALVLNEDFSNWQNIELIRGKDVRQLKPRISKIIGGVPCIQCGGNVFHKKGFTYNDSGKFQMYQCNQCGACRIGEKTAGINKKNIPSLSPLCEIPCEKCGTVDYHKKGLHKNSRGTFQMLQCTNCGTCRVGEMAV